MPKTCIPILLILIALLNTACSWSDLPLSGMALSTPPPSTHRILTIDQVADAGEPGRFTVSGQYTLPGEAELTVSAVRRLGPPEQSPDDPAALYGILDRRTATLEDGRWRATLTLWEASAEGRYQEAWQRPEAALVDSARPEPTVEFLVTIEPAEFAQSVSLAIPRQLEAAIDELVYFTPEGEPYLRVGLSQPISLPSNQRASTLTLTPPPESPWQGRTTLDGTNTAIEAITDSPFLPEDNLPLSPNRLMQ